MSKRSNIKWRESDEQALRRAVKNFNAKISRLEKKDPKNKSALPERISAKHMKELIQTRQDFNREINALKRFSKRGAEEIVFPPDEYGNYTLKITKWQRTEMLRRANIINQRRKRKRDEVANLEMEDAGKKLGYRRGDFGMGSLDDAQLEPLKPFTRTMTQTERKLKYETLMDESRDRYWSDRDQMLIDNYIKSLTDNFPKQKVQTIIDKVQNMDPKEFRKTFEANGGSSMFEWSYPLTDDEVDPFVDKLESIWNVNS